MTDDRTRKKIGQDLKVYDISKTDEEEDPEMVKYLKKYFISQLTRYYRNRGDMEKAVASVKVSLFKAIRERCTKERLLNMLFFKDYSGVSKAIKGFKASNLRFKFIESIIGIVTGDKNVDCSDTTILKLVKSGLEDRFMPDFVNVLCDFYKRNCKKCFLKCLNDGLMELRDIFTEEYLSTITYNNLKAMYKIMPYKDIFLQRMVKINPFISYRYYKEYALTYGLHKEDILRILSVVYRRWALLIAIDKGWISDSFRIILERHFVNGQKLINRKGTSRKSERKERILFLKRLKL